jgi:hypothetical protein
MRSRSIAQNGQGLCAPWCVAKAWRPSLKRLSKSFEADILVVSPLPPAMNIALMHVALVASLLSFQPIRLGG